MGIDYQFGSGIWTSAVPELAQHTHIYKYIYTYIHTQTESYISSSWYHSWIWHMGHNHGLPTDFTGPLLGAVPERHPGVRLAEAEAQGGEAWPTLVSLDA